MKTELKIAITETIKLIESLRLENRKRCDLLETAFSKDSTVIFLPGEEECLKISSLLLAQIFDTPTESIEEELEWYFYDRAEEGEVSIGEKLYHVVDAESFADFLIEAYTTRENL